MYFSTNTYFRLPLLLSLMLGLSFSNSWASTSADLNLSVRITKADATCVGVSDGIVVATPDGGAPPYSYLWSNGATTATVRDLAPGTYTVTVTDNVSNTATATATVEAAPGFQISLAPTYETCTGSSDAKVDIVFDQAGVPPYTYLWSTGDTGFQLTGVGIGDYSVTVTDSRGCTAESTTTVELSPEGIWLKVTATDASCGQDNGTANVNIMTGVPPFNILWSNGGTTTDITGLTAGLYTVTVTDVNGCSNVDSARVNQIGSNLQISLVPSFETCTGSSDAKVDIVFDQAGTTPYTYLWSTGDTDFQLTGVGVGNYSVTVTDADGCTATASTTVELSPEGIWVKTTATDTECGLATGTANVNIMTGTAPFNINWSNGGTTADIVNLAAGQYFVTVTDVNGCSAVDSVIVNTSNPPDAGIIFTGDTLRFCIDDGNPDIVRVTSTGNTGTNFRYVITDSNGNILNVTTNNEFDFEGTGVGVCRIYGLAYEGTINGATVGQNISGITGCFDLAGPIEVTRTSCPPPPSCDANAGTLSTNNARVCLENGSADISAVPNGDAVVPIGFNTLYVLTTGSDQTIVQTSNSPAFTVTDTGTYTIHTLVYDPNTLDLSIVVLGTTTAAQVNALLIQGGGTICASLDLTGVDVLVEDCGVPCAPPVLLNVVVIEASCDMSDGRATLIVAGDPAAFSYHWSPNVSNTFEANNIPVGTYSVTITDNRDSANCSLVEVFTVGAKNGPDVEIVQQTPATCKEANGTATLSPINLVYLWCNGATGNNVTNLPAGECQVIAIDPATQCTTVVELVIEEFNPLMATVQIDELPDCNMSNGAVTIVPSGGSTSYQFDWSDGGSGASRTDLASGIYNVTVTDLGATGCERVVTFTLVDDVPGAEVEVEAIAFISCPRADDGEAIFTVTPSAGFAGPAVVTIEDAAGNQYVNGKLPPGNYCIIVRDANGCLAGSGCFEVQEPSQIDVDVAIFNKDCLNDGSITLDISGGTAPYTVDWDDLTGNNDPEDRLSLLPGTYAFTVTDANGCTASASGLVLEDECDCERPEIESIVVQEANCGEQDGSAIINLVGSPGAYSFDWSPSVSSDNSAFNIAAGTYTVTIRDTADRDCAIEETFTVGHIGGPDVTVSTTDAGCGLADGTATLSPSTLTYEWSDGGMGASRTDLAEGRYFVTATDATQPDCPEYLTVVIGTANRLRGTATVDVKPQCNSADGSVTLTASGGSSDYSFSWTDGFRGAVRTGLASGIYQVTIVDNVNNGCSTVLTFSLTDDVPVAEVNITSVGVQTSCIGTDDGRVEFSPIYSGGFVQPASITIVDADGNEYTNGDLGEGTYCIIIRDGNDCLAGSSCFEVSKPDQIDLDFEILDGGCDSLGSITVTDLTGGNGGFVFDWSDLNLANEPRDRFDLPAGNYSCTVTDAKGCSVASVLQVEGPEELISVDATAEAVSCDPTEQVQALSNTAVSYTWFNESGTRVGSGRDTTVDITNGGLFYVIATDAFGCTASDTLMIMDGALDIELNGPALACEGSTTQLEVINNKPTDTLTYQWSPANLIEAGGMTATPVINTDSLGPATYTVVVTNQFGCSDTKSISVGIVDTTANADLISFSQCKPDTIDFMVNGLDTRYYIWNFGDLTTDSDTASGSMVSYVYPGPGSYLVTLALPNGTGCPIDTISKLIDVVEPPLAELAFDWEYTSCADTAVIQLTDQSIHATGDIEDWQWVVNGMDTLRVQNPSLTIRQSESLIVDLQIITEDGCIENMQDTIDIDLLEVNLNDREVCPMDTVNLNPDGNSSYSYLWSPGEVLDNPTAVDPKYIAASAQTFDVIVSDSMGNCQITRSMSVMPRTDLSNFSASEDSTNTCDQNDITLTADGTGVASFQWMDEAGAVISREASATVTPGEPGISESYFVMASDQYGCMGMDTTVVTNREVRFSFPEPIVPACVNSDKEVLILIDQASGPDVSIEWSPEGIIKDQTDPLAPIINAQEDGFLVALVSNPFGCSKKDSVEIDVIDLDDELNISVSPDTICEQGQQIQLFVTDDMNYTYNWSDDGTISDTSIPDPMASPGTGVNPGNQDLVTYSVTVTDENGCTGTRSIDITVIIPDCGEPWIFFPNAFTPNDDGRNDRLRPRGFNIDQVYWIIYNRWGEKIYEANNIEQSWDGTFNGEKLSPDVYGFYLRVTCTGGQTFTKKGNVTLLR
ncbi:MAG: gliding motility-associated C-terminal domain-containing protein [Bacteroidota bacterium]